MRAAIARQNRRRLLAGGGIGAAALVIVVVVVAVTGGGGEASDAATNSTATAEITRQDLVETDSADGTLGYGDSREVVNRLTGTVTGLPAVGKVVQPDGVLYRVDGTPVILMNGRVPAYRALSPSVSDGADVTQLEQDLRDLGYDPGGAMTVDDSWDSGTTAAVKRWQDAHGFSETGSIELGRIVFQPGSRRVSKVDTTLGSDGSSSGGGGNDPTASAGDDAATDLAAATPTTGRTQFASYSPATSPVASAAQAPTTTAPAATDPDAAAKLKAAEEKAKREEARRKAAERKAAQLEAEAKKNSAAQQNQPSGGNGGTPSAGPSSSGGSGGDSDTGSNGGTGGGAATPIITTTSTRPVVTVKLATDKATLAHDGSAVTVTLPSGDPVTGKVSSVGKVATTETSSDGNESDPTIEVSVKLPSKTKGLDQAPVSVDFEQSRRRDVLAIPVTALLARAGGKFAVEVRDGGGRRLVPVEPGLYAGGFVEISGQGLKPGTKVTDARI